MKIKTKIYITFWVLWALCLIGIVSFNSFFAQHDILIIWATMFSCFVFPIIGLVIVAIFSQDKEKQRKLTEKERKEKKEREMKEQIMAEEKSRTKIEQYKIGKIGKFYIVPMLVFFVFGFLFIWDLHINEVPNWYLGSIFVLCGIPVFVTDIESKWSKKLQCKKELLKSKQISLVGNYQEDCIYTDNQSDYFFYKIAKIISILMTILSIIGLSIIGYLWLDNITITSTTIIIILLIIIIFQNAERK